MLAPVRPARRHPAEGAPRRLATARGQEVRVCPATGLGNLRAEPPGLPHRRFLPSSRYDVWKSWLLHLKGHYRGIERMVSRRILRDLAKLTQGQAGAIFGKSSQQRLRALRAGEED